MDNCIPTFKSTGKLIYDPRRPGMKRRINWWSVIMVDREITRYYRWWVKRMFWGRTSVNENWLCEPSWNAHISVVRGEKPPLDKMNLWKKYHGEIIEFHYEHYPIRGGSNTSSTEKGQFWLIEVHCPRITEIRDELGLKTFYKYHLTIGRTYIEELKYV
jgi:hypothetical protein